MKLEQHHDPAANTGRVWCQYVTDTGTPCGFVVGFADALEALMLARGHAASTGHPVTLEETSTTTVTRSAR